MLAAASMQDYFSPGKYPWQGPLMLVFVVGWIVGGAYLLRQKLKGQQKLRKRKLSWYMLVMILSALAAMALGGVIAYTFDAIGRTMESQGFTIAGACIGGVIALATALLVIYAMTDLPFGVAAKAAVTPLAAGVGLGIVVGLGCFLPVRGVRTFEAQRDTCIYNLQGIARSLMSYQTAYDSMPPSLDILITASNMDPQYLKCPGAPPGQASYFYLPVPTPRNNVPEFQVRACDFLRNHDGKGRNVLFVTGDVRWRDESEFQELMGKPENANFAKALAIVEAGGKLPATRSPSSSPAPTTSKPAK